MRIIKSKTFYLSRFILSACLLFMNLFSVKAHDVKWSFKDIYITIKSSNENLQSVFTLIEQQTSFSFVYDENDINLSKQITLPKGQQRLKDVLDDVSEQAGLHFTEKKNIILVNAGRAAIKRAVFKLSDAPVTGVVQDVLGNPLVGVTVSIKGSAIATQTNENGQFSINAPDDAVLIFSMVGFKTQQVSLKGTSSLDIKMVPADKELNEVVVVGYQTQRRSNITGAVSTVNVEDVSKIPIGFADQALQGQVSGVRITQSTGQPGDGIAMRIQGCWFYQ